MLSQLGCVSLPDETVRKLYDGEAIDDAERNKLIDNMDTTNKILSNIPRLEPVTELAARCCKFAYGAERAQGGRADPAAGVAAGRDRRRYAGGAGIRHG